MRRNLIFVLNRRWKIMLKYTLHLLLLISLLCGSCSTESTSNDAREQQVEPQVDNSQDSESEEAKEEGFPIILFLGNSLTAGYGIEKNQAFPALIQNKLDSIGAKYQVVNAGVSGETTAGGREKVDWYLKQKPTIFVLELGGNDALRGINPDETRENLSAIIEAVREKYPECKILLAGMEAPPNMGDDYASKFRQMVWLAFHFCWILWVEILI